MSTELIIAIVVIALILIALFAFVLPRARRSSQVKARERELAQRREERAQEHRQEAHDRRSQADMAEQRAKVAAAEAERERAEAKIREQRAQMHERGMADDELIDDHERDRFAGTSALPEESTSRSDERAHGDERPLVAGTHDSTSEDRPMHEPSSEYEQGRVDERREHESDGRLPADDRTRSA